MDFGTPFQGSCGPLSGGIYLFGLCLNVAKHMATLHTKKGTITLQSNLTFCWFERTLWLLNIAMDNGPFIDGLPIKMVIFHGYVSHNQMVSWDL